VTHCNYNSYKKCPNAHFEQLSDVSEHLRQAELQGTQTLGITTDMNCPSGHFEAQVVLCRSL
jgi:hypothetical protein